MTLFGLACSPRATWILDAYVAALGYVLARYDDQTSSDVVTRDELQEHLEFDPHCMDVGSRVLTAGGNPFLAGGNPNFKEWALSIDERVVNYEDVTNRHQLIRQLAEERLAPHLPVARQDEPDVEAQHVVPVASAVAIALGLGADALSVAVAPAPLSAGVIAASITAVLLRHAVFRTRPSPPCVKTALLRLLDHLAVHYRHERG